MTETCSCLCECFEPATHADDKGDVCDLCAHAITTHENGDTCCPLDILRKLFEGSDIGSLRRHFEIKFSDVEDFMDLLTATGRIEIMELDPGMYSIGKYTRTPTEEKKVAEGK